MSLSMQCFASSALYPSKKRTSMMQLNIMNRNFLVAKNRDKMNKSRQLSPRLMVMKLQQSKNLWWHFYCKCHENVITFEIVAISELFLQFFRLCFFIIFLIGVNTVWREWDDLIAPPCCISKSQFGLKLIQDKHSERKK